MASTNYLYINTNGDMWVVEGEAGGQVDTTVERYEGVPDAVVARLQGNGWKLNPEIRDQLRDLPLVEF